MSLPEADRALTYVVLVILIALWAMVLLPPYLKDRRASGRTFGSIQSTGSGGVNPAQRFLPLQNASSSYSTSAVNSPTGIRTSGVGSLSAGMPGSANLGAMTLAPANLGGTSQSPSDLSGGNVVQLRPVDSGNSPDGVRAPLATSAANYLEEMPLADESALHQAWDTPESAGIGMPSSTAAARERRRQVLLSLTGVALVTLMLALFAGGRWVAAHVLVDVVMMGYVILLVRHRQLMADRMTKVEPIRPPVSEQLPSSVQLAPSYLLRSKTGS